ncbi:MAG: CarD family transcriptional regulator, partial [bacterium]|nr:CarD family transcriptional regulator [bacterium]
MSTKTVKTIQYWTGVPETAKPYVLAASPLASKGAVLLFSKNPKTWEKQIRFWQARQNTHSTSPRIQTLFLDLNNLNYTFLSHLQKSEPSIFIAPLDLLDQKIPSPQELKTHSISLQKGQKINLPKVIGALLQNGYRKEKNADAPGCFATRGGIIDIFPVFHNHAARLELFGDKIESIKTPDSNKIIQQFSNLTIPPLTVQNPQGAILDWLSPDATLILDEPEPALKKIFSSPYKGEARRGLKFNLVAFEAFPPTQENVTKFIFRQPPLFLGKLQLLAEKIKQYKNKKYQIFIASKRLPDPENRLPFALSAGFLDPTGHLLVLTDTEIFGFRKTRQRSRRFALDAEFLANLSPGMHIVHIDHGIGRFSGIIERELDQIKREYFCLEYGFGDKLFLPIDQAEKITRYIGRENPILHRLHGGIWHEIKRQAEKDSRKMAQELLKIQASRETEKGFVFSPDTPDQNKMEASFPYTETPDQEKAIAAVKADMEASKPMDRLICGDVGFGKTEVAMRAAFKARENQKQVCLLAPTTILAQQHFDTFQKRLKSFGARIALLTRFQSQASQKKILRELCQGEIEIIIGTHRLLSSDVKFFNLGLIIIDEEQRFGVRHKEKLKSLRPNLDILTLSATPIPRTLHFALSGLREISA